MLNVETDFSGKYPIITAAGPLDSENADLLEVRIEELAAKSPYWILNLKEVNYLSSAGIRSILKLYHILENRKGFFVVAEIIGPIYEVMRTTGLLESLIVAVDNAEAQSIIENRLQERKKDFEYVTVNGKYRVSVEEKNFSTMKIRAQADSEKSKNISADLTPIEIEADEFSLGIAGLGKNRSEAAKKMGVFLSYGTMTGSAPAGSEHQSDIVLNVPDKAFTIFPQWAVTVSGKPILEFTLKSGNKSSINALLEDIIQLLHNKSCKIAYPVFCIIAGRVDNLAGHYFKTTEDIENIKYTKYNLPLKPSGVLAIAMLIPEKFQDKLPAYLTRAVSANPRIRNFGVYSHAVTISDLAWLQEADICRNPEQIEIYLDNLQEVVVLDTATQICEVKATLFIPREFTSESLTTQIDSKDAEIPCEWEIICRRIYRSWSKIAMKKLANLTGSFVYMVKDSTDEDDSISLLRLDSIDCIEQERKNLERFLPELKQAGFTIIDTAKQGNHAGIGYLPHRHREKRIKLLTLSEAVKKKSARNLIKIIDRIFTHTLKPWYSSPLRKVIYPYYAHDPVRKFPGVEKFLEDFAGLNSENPEFYCPEAGRNIANPLYFITKHIPARHDNSLEYYKVRNHGRLVPENIIIDDKNNVCLLDFSQSAEVNAAVDFAMLETGLKISLLAPHNENDLANLLMFEAGLLQPDCMSAKPSFEYSDNNRMVNKVFAIIVRLRYLADRVTIFDENFTPYLLVLFENLIVSLNKSGLSDLHTRFIIASAGLTAEKILKLESNT